MLSRELNEYSLAGVCNVLLSRELNEYSLVGVSNVLLSQELNEYSLVWVSNVLFSRELNEYSLAGVSNVLLIGNSVKVVVHTSIFETFAETCIITLLLAANTIRLSLTNSLPRKDVYTR